MLKLLPISTFLLASCCPCQCPEPDHASGTGGASASSTSVATTSSVELDAGTDARVCVEPRTNQGVCTNSGDCWPGNTCLHWECVDGRCLYRIPNGAGCNAGPGYWHCEEGACCQD